MEDCLFCKIAAGEIPSNKLFEDDKLLVNYRFHPILVSSRRKNPGLCRSPIFCGSRQTIRLPY